MGVRTNTHMRTHILTIPALTALVTPEKKHGCACGGTTATGLDGAEGEAGAADDGCNAGVLAS